MRRPRWQQEGQEPDYRYSLANERTFLAWIRTALAVLAAGVVLDQFTANLGPRWLLVAVAVGLAALGAALYALAYWRWKANEQAMRHAQPLPSSAAIPLLAFSLAGVALGLSMLLLG